MVKKILKLSLMLAAAAGLIFLIIYTGRTSSGTLHIAGDDNFSKKRCLVVVVHGWIDKGIDSWPQDMAFEIAKKADSQLWACCFFDWSAGAATINPSDAVRFAREKAAATLASEVSRKFHGLNHIHLIGHSSGCWVINDAAKILAQNTPADLHLTFLDAYAPDLADANSLGNIPVKKGQQLYVEHYFTRDYTGSSTEIILNNAHNIDITPIDAAIKDHKFPWRWYYATISGKYPSSIFSDGLRYSCIIDGIEYGFALSMEAGGEKQWLKILQLKAGNEPLICGRTDEN